MNGIARRFSSIFVRLLRLSADRAYFNVRVCRSRWRRSDTLACACDRPASWCTWKPSTQCRFPNADFKIQVGKLCGSISFLQQHDCKLFSACLNNRLNCNIVSLTDLFPQECSCGHLPPHRRTQREMISAGINVLYVEARDPAAAFKGRANSHRHALGTTQAGTFMRLKTSAGM